MRKARGVAHRRLLIPTDFSPASISVIRLSLALTRFEVEEVLVLHVVDAHGLESFVARAKVRGARAKLDEVLASIEAGAVTLSGRVETGVAERRVLDACDDFGADAIVLASTGKKPIEELLLGSLSEQVTRLATVPVLFVRFPVVKAKLPDEIARIGDRVGSVVVHPTDFSECSGRALDEALTLKPERLVLTHTVDDSGLTSSEADARAAHVRRRLATIRSRVARSAGAVDVHVGMGDAAASVRRLAASEGTDLVVLGSRGKSLVTETIIGSVSQEILRSSEVPVMVIH